MQTHSRAYHPALAPRRGHGMERAPFAPNRALAHCDRLASCAVAGADGPLDRRRPGANRRGSWELLGAAALAFLAYAALIPFPARWIGRRFSLGIGAQRTLVFSAGTRNSFVVLPFSLTLPPEWRLAVAVIVLQSLIELGAMVAYLVWIPRRILRDGGVQRP